MANVCSYKVKVRGKRNACYAFFGSMSAYDKDILEESGTEDNTTIIFEGTCKGGVDAYCKEWEGRVPVDIPADADEALNKAEEEYWYYTVQERSAMFNVEVWCNSTDLDAMEDYDNALNDLDFEDFDMDTDSFDELVLYEHYINGEEIDDDCPEELNLFNTEDDFREYDDEECYYDDEEEEELDGYEEYDALGESIMYADEYYGEKAYED